MISTIETPLTSIMRGYTSVSFTNYFQLGGYQNAMRGQRFKFNTVCIHVDVGNCWDACNCINLSG